MRSRISLKWRNLCSPSFHLLKKNERSASSNREGQDEVFTGSGPKPRSLMQVSIIMVLNQTPSPASCHRWAKWKRTNLLSACPKVSDWTRTTTALWIRSTEGERGWKNHNGISNYDGYRHCQGQRFARSPWVYMWGPIFITVQWKGRPRFRFEFFWT